MSRVAWVRVLGFAPGRPTYPTGGVRISPGAVSQPTCSPSANTNLTRLDPKVPSVIDREPLLVLPLMHHLMHQGVQYLFPWVPANVPQQIAISAGSPLLVAII